MAEPKSPGNAIMKNYTHMDFAKIATSMLIIKFIKKNLIIF